MIPDNVRKTLQWALVCAQDEVDSWRGTTSEGDPQKEFNAAIDDATGWLDAQPAAPEPDWSHAPEEATHCTINADGSIKWWHMDSGEPDHFIDGRWHLGGSYGYDCTYHLDTIDIPLGIDWRLCKWQRPQETSHERTD